MAFFYQLCLKNVPKVLTYSSQEEIPLGSLVRVPLGKKTTNAVIISQCPQPEYDCVEITEVLIPAAVSQTQLLLCDWIKQYYFCSLKKTLQLFLPRVIWEAKMQPEYEQFVSLRTSKTEALEKCSRAKKQQEAIQILSEHKKISLQLLKKKVSTNIIKELHKKDLLQIEEGSLLNPDENHRSKPHHDQPLTQEQSHVLENIQKNKGAKPVLLHGVTGSGKTEIYLQLIQEQIEKGNQCLLLVPEIALTTELIQYFSEHFPDKISILHSRLSDRQRLQSWHRIHQQETQLILGSRSALFTPWQKLGLIIIDEEHEWTYKQDASPRYHARKVAEKIQSISKNKPQDVIELLLGSATPSIESFYKAQAESGAYLFLEMTQRATPMPLPKVHLVDLRDEFKKKNYNMFSELLQEGIQSRLEKKQQVVLFLNKRGASSSITCRDCGYTPQCEHCDIALTFHNKLREFQGGGLVCHYCGSFQDQPQKCPQCDSSAIRYLGTGTQKAEQQLQELFPAAKILRADKDTTGGKEDFEKIYHMMREEKADILLGTQMIAKGLDLPKVTLTGVLLADIGLHTPDFRASERVFQLLTQVAGRSGRHQKGEVIIQTYQPFHPALQAAKNHDYLQFYQQEISTRKMLDYPPYSNMMKLIYAHPHAKTAADESLRVYGILQDKLQNNPTPSEHIELAPHYIARLHGKYIWNIYIRGKNPQKYLEGLQLQEGWKIDVDPL